MNIAAALLTGVLTATPVASAPVRAELLPTSGVAVDVSPAGVVVASSPLRWVRIPGRGWVAQRLALPAGATAGSVTGVTDLGEPAGEVTVDGVSRAARWSVTGRSATLIGGDRSRVSAVGPYGPWGVATTAPDLIAGSAEIVTRSGARTPVTSDTGYRFTVTAIARPDLALFGTIEGIGRGATGRVVLWQDGAQATLPVINSFFLPNACVSRLLPDGSVVASGWNNYGGTPNYVMVRHTGGVPGTEVELSRVTGAGQPYGGLTCTTDLDSNTLAADGGIAGYVSEGGVSRAAFWNAANERTVVPLLPGETSATGVAVATGGRMIIRSEGEDGVSRLAVWRDGARTPLAVPAGWTVASVVELTDAGLLIANLRDAEGATRVAAWRVR